MDSMPVFTIVPAGASTSGANWSMASCAMCCRLAAGPALALSMTRVASAPPSLDSCSEKVL
eukprot:11560797-Heterocapsa_arctica.AAC.1